MKAEIDGVTLGSGQRPYVVAELSANHNGHLEQALKLIELAKLNGADAVKIQTYRADTITLDSDASEFQITEGPWAGQTLYELYQSAHTPWEWHAALFEKAKDVGITLFSSPFDPTAIDLLETLDCPAYKIASFELNDLGLIKAAAKTGKPLIMSTGMANEQEIDDAVAAARNAGCEVPILLRCVSAYPANPEDYNLAMIPALQRRYNTLVGLSDHTLSGTAAIASTALGACFIEKHFTLSRQGGGPDDSFSMEPEDLRLLSETVKETFSALGSPELSPPVNKQNSKFKRSLYFVQSAKAGDVITEDMVRSVRPSSGIAPKHLDRVLGKRLQCDIVKNTPVRFEDIVLD